MLKSKNRFTPLENLDAEVEINRPWGLLERISKFQPKREYYELKKHKP
jgi:hypothetical protein